MAPIISVCFSSGKSGTHQLPLHTRIKRVVAYGTRQGSKGKRASNKKSFQGKKGRELYFPIKREKKKRGAWETNITSFSLSFFFLLSLFFPNKKRVVCTAQKVFPEIVFKAPSEMWEQCKLHFLKEYNHMVTSLQKRSLILLNCLRRKRGGREISLPPC